MFEEPLPLEVDKDGVIRVSRTRVTLDTIVAAFNEGFAAEEIAQQYPTVPLADVYSVIGFYLRRREDIDEYIGERQKVSEGIRRQNEARFDTAGIRERLMRRRMG